MDRKRARQLVQSPPGRGVTRDGRELVIAVSRFDTSTADRLRTRYAGRCAPRIEVLPAHVEYDALTTHSRVRRPGTQIAIGIGEAELTPVAIDFAAEAHLIILGQGSVVRRACCAPSAARSFVRTPQTPRNCSLSIFAARCSASSSPNTFRGTYRRGGADTATGSAGATTRDADTRCGGHPAAITDTVLVVGTEIYVVIDDYDLVAPPTGGNPLTAS